MPERDTSWRQGSVLTQFDASNAGLFCAESCHNKWAIIISHDCDLRHPDEAHIEVIVGTECNSNNKEYARARHVRNLHLAFHSPNGKTRYLELHISEKRSIPKSFIAGEASPDNEWILPAEEKRALKQWLAARYGRPAFPDAFERHLRKKCGKHTVEDKLRKVLARQSEHLIGVFFDLDEHRGVELLDGTPYSLGIIIVYDHLNMRARNAADKVATEITSIFLDAYGQPGETQEIALDACEAIPDSVFSLSDVRKTDQWRVEHLSLRHDPAEPFLAAGELAT